MTGKNYRDQGVKIGIARITEIILWTRRGRRALDQCEAEYGDHYYEVMRRGLAAIDDSDGIVGRADRVRYVSVTLKGYEFLRAYGPEAYR